MDAMTWSVIGGALHGMTPRALQSLQSSAESLMVDGTTISIGSLSLDQFLRGIIVKVAHSMAGSGMRNAPNKRTEKMKRFGV